MYIAEGALTYQQQLELMVELSGWKARAETAEAKIATLADQDGPLFVDEPDGEWQPIETAAKDGTKIDVWAYWPEHGVSYRVTDASWTEYDGRGGWLLNGYVDYTYAYPPQVTHWRKRPTPPAGSED